jgi:hypothetical protein
MTEKEFFILWSTLSFWAGWIGHWYTRKYILPRLRHW